MSSPIKRMPPKYEILNENIQVTRPSENGQGTHIIWYPRQAYERIPYPHHSTQAQSLETESISIPLAYGPGPFSRYNSVSIRAEEMDGVLPNTKGIQRAGRLIYTQSLSTEDFSSTASTDRPPYQAERHEVPPREPNSQRGSDSGRTVRPGNHSKVLPMTPFSSYRSHLSSFLTPVTRRETSITYDGTEMPRAMTPPYVSASEYNRMVENKAPVNIRVPSKFGAFDACMSRAETPAFTSATAETGYLIENQAQAQIQVLSPGTARRATLRSATKRRND